MSSILMKKQWIIFSFLLIHGLVFGQRKSSLINEGNYYFEVNDFFSSIFYFEKVLEKDSSLTSVYYPLAESYRQTNQYSKAIAFYRKVLTSDQSSNYPNALLFLGMTLKNISNYEDASLVLQQFLDQLINPSDYWYRKGLMELKGSEMAKRDSFNSNYQITHLGDKVNSRESDFAPFVDEQGRLFFSTMEKDDGLAKEVYLGHRSKLMIADSGQSAQDYNVFNDLNYHIANLSFNPDGSEAFFSKCKNYKDQLRCELYSSQFVDGFWQKPQRLDERFNASGANNTHPQWALWNGQEGLFISSNRIGGIGGLDVWFVPFRGSPQHLGNGINTQGNEVTPFYHSTQKVLYFSSDFHPGLGGFDIFQCPWQDEWGLVGSLARPINSSANDLYYVTQLDSSHLGYFSSNRKGSQSISYESCCNDIYAFEKTEQCVCVAIDSIAQDMQLNLPLSVYFHNDEPKPNSTDSTTSVNYTQAYQSFQVLKEQYVGTFSSVLAGHAKNEAERQMRAFFDQTVSGGYQRLASFTQQLEEILLLGASVELRLKGFTSPLTDSDYNQLLAKRRISSVTNYLSAFNDSSLYPFLQKEQLRISELPLGETQVDTTVSDNPNDKRNSVYSIKAARERRIEIQSISVEF